MNADKLDNPVWYSLSETHQEYAVDYGNIKFYHPDYCAFGGFNSSENITDHIDAYAKLENNFFVIGEKPFLSSSLKFQKELVCLQMLIANEINIEIKEQITPLTDEHNDALFQLVTLVQPGYFKQKTAMLGRYFGIFKHGQLVSVCGERMKMDAFTEISAIVTHPDHIGRGYAKQLITHTVNNIFNQDKMPYLHVTASNTGAIRLYEKLGFVTRRTISFWNISNIIL